MTEKRQSQVVILKGPKQLEFQARELVVDPFPLIIFRRDSCYGYFSRHRNGSMARTSPLRPGPTYPRLVGYCNVARVLHCGEGCSTLKPGDRVLTFSSHCSSFVLPESEILAVLPTDLTNDHAVLAYLFHLGYSAILSASKPPGTNAVVLGLGVLGLTSCAMAQLAGWQVSAVTEQAPVSALQGVNFYRRNEPPAPASAQVVIVTSGHWSDWDLALRLAAQRAEIVVLGFPGRETPSIPFNPLRPEDFYQRQLRITASGLS